MSSMAFKTHLKFAPMALTSPVKPPEIYTKTPVGLGECPET